eukprot:3769343-Pyramimonas_sp.AAC.2
MGTRLLNNAAIRGILTVVRYGAASYRDITAHVITVQWGQPGRPPRMQALRLKTVHRSNADRPPLTVPH